MTKLLSIVIEFFKKDLGLRIGYAFLSSGAMLLGGFQFVINVVPTTTSVTLQTSQVAVYIIGGLLLVIGIIILLHRYYLWNIENSIQDIALFYFPGFTNINPDTPLYALPKSQQIKTKPISYGKIDSYDPGLLASEYKVLNTFIERRSEHNKIQKAYIAALGSIPFLYLIGTLFRDGHIPTDILEHNRATDKWHQLNLYGNSKSLEYHYQNITGKEAQVAVRPNENNEIGISISFTHLVNKEELPKSISNNTIDITLLSGQSFDAIPHDSAQDDIVKEISHLITSLAKKAGKIHLFISAQASLVVKLGKSYHNNMTNVVVIHNYASKQKEYKWGIEFNGSVNLDVVELS